MDLSAEDLAAVDATIARHESKAAWDRLASCLDTDPAAAEDSLRGVLRSVFHHSDFRGPQLWAIRRVLQVGQLCVLVLRGCGCW